MQTAATLNASEDDGTIDDAIKGGPRGQLGKIHRERPKAESSAPRSVLPIGLRAEPAAAYACSYHKESDQVQHVAGTIIDGKYELEQPLGQGGMGSVWVARHRMLDVLVAVKLMSPALAASAEARVRFEREAKAAAQLKSPYVVDVRDYGIDGDTPYLVLELLEGEDLAARLRRRQHLSPAEAGAILAQVAKALGRAHETGIVHRDLKPANLFLTRTDDGEVVKILDFGIARARAPGLTGDATKTGSLLGSPHYMSPEQARGASDLDHRSDLWSLGVILFRALTGQLPFRGEQVGDIIVKVCADPIPVASLLAPSLPPGIDRFFERALERDRDRRFASVREMAEAFAEITTPTVLLPAQAPAAERTIELGAAGWGGNLEKTAQPPSSGSEASAETLTTAGQSIAEPAPPKSRKALWITLAVLVVALPATGMMFMRNHAAATAAPATSFASAAPPTPQPAPSPDEPNGMPLASAAPSSSAVPVITTRSSPGPGIKRTATASAVAPPPKPPPLSSPPVKPSHADDPLSKSY